jgi:glutamate dehydrogenase (NAD(P)+)
MATIPSSLALSGAGKAKLSVSLNGDIANIFYLVLHALSNTGYSGTQSEGIRLHSRYCSICLVEATAELRVFGMFVLYFRRDDMSGALTVGFHMQKAARVLDLPSTYLKMLSLPRRALRANLCVRRDDGEKLFFEGWRIQHCHAAGPMMGGFRLHPTVCAAEMEELAAFFALRSVLHRLPLGGSMGGIRCDVNTLSKVDEELLTKAYVAEFSDCMGPTADIMTPDIGSHSEHMAWTMQARAAKHGFSPAAAVMKPMTLHGSEGCVESAGIDAVMVTQQLLLMNSLSLRDAPVVVHGFGEVGMQIADELFQKKAKVLAVSDEHSAVTNPEGLDVPSLRMHKLKMGTLVGFAAGAQVGLDDMWSMPCAVRFYAASCAVGEGVNDAISERMQCQWFVEAVPLPMAAEANDVLKRRGIVVVPDLLATGGRAVASYFEWAQNMQHMRWRRPKLMKELHLFMTEALGSVQEVAMSKACSLKTAAYVVAMSRLAKARFALGN